jgi:hypothetical protein
MDKKFTLKRVWGGWIKNLHLSGYGWMDSCGELCSTKFSALASLQKISQKISP